MKSYKEPYFNVFLYFHILFQGGFLRLFNIYVFFFNIHLFLNFRKILNELSSDSPAVARIEEEKAEEEAAAASLASAPVPTSIYQTSSGQYSECVCMCRTRQRWQKYTQSCRSTDTLKLFSFQNVLENIWKTFRNFLGRSG